jgi:flagellar biosynthesis GTPase FlhF
VDLDTAADELYGISPDDFIERRQQLVAGAKQAGDRQLATQIGKFRRPTRSAWLINLLARQAPDDITALLDLGAALQEAQQRMAGDELRQLSAERRRTVDAMARHAVELGHDHGYDAPDGAVQEVGQTLQTALGDPEIAELVRGGRLTQAVTYGGFGPTDLASALGASLPTNTPSRSEKATEAPAAAPKRDAKQRQAAEKAAAEAREQATEARQAADSAEQEAEAATQRADDLADQVETLRTQLRQSEAAEREARDEARAARKHFQELRQAALTTEQAAAAAEQALEGSGAP